MHAHTPPFTLPDDAAARKAIPLASGLLDYFPNALIAVASLSFIANEQHNPGEPLHWNRAKSTDHDDCLMRHFMARGTVDTDGIRHRAKVAWRALAALEEELEREAASRLPNAANWIGYDLGIANHSGDAFAYLASFAPNADIPVKSPKGDTRIATAAEIDNLRDLLSAEELKGFGIGDVEPATLRGIPDSFIDSHGNRITRRDVAEIATTVATSQHPMAAEALRDEYERADKESGV